MDYFDLNMECIKKYRNTLYLKLMDESIFPILTNKPETIESVDARDGSKVLLLRHKQQEYRLNSIYRPLDEAKRWAEQFTFQSLDNVMAMYGLGNGVFARAIMEKLKEDDYLFIYEPSYAVFEHVLHHYDITDIIRNKHIILGIEGLNELEYRLNLKGAIVLSNLKSQYNCAIPNYEKIFPESYRSFYQELRDVYTSVQINVNTMIAFGERYIENTLKNTKFIKDCYSLSQIKRIIPKDVPAIVVAAGPSLQDEIENLKKIKGKAVIFSVDKTLGYLMKHGVKPDFVVTLDPKKSVRYVRLDEEVKIPLICFYESNYALLEEHKGRKILCTSGNFVEEFYIKTKKDVPELMLSGSVAIVAFTACVQLGFKRIALVGQDLAYRDGFSHVGQVVDTRSEKDRNYVEGLDGKPVKSRYDWKEFILRYQDLIALCKEKGIEVIDTKKQGAKIKGTVLMPMDEVIDKYCSKQIDLESSLAALESAFSKEDMQVVKQQLQSNLVILRKMKEKAISAEKLCDTIIRQIKSCGNCNTEDTEKLKKINHYIEEQKIYSLMDSYISGKTAKQLALIFQFTDNDVENDLMVFERSRSVYRAVIEAADFTKEKLEEALECL